MVNKVLVSQLLLTVIAGFAAFLYQGTAIAASVVFGGFVALALSWWLGRNIKTLDRQLANQQMATQAMFALGFLPRMLLVVLAFAFGIGYLRLDPLPMAAMFSLTYIVYWVELYRSRQVTSDTL